MICPVFLLGAKQRSIFQVDCTNTEAVNRLGSLFNGDVKFFFQITNDFSFRNYSSGIGLRLDVDFLEIY